jgi:hypothetical protein
MHYILESNATMKPISITDFIQQLGDLESYLAGLKSQVQALQGEAAFDENLKKLGTLKQQIEEFVYHEGRAPSLTKPADAEIFRQPLVEKRSIEDSPIFIIGNRRSGTTLIAYLLNSSPNICALPENFFASEVIASEKLFSGGHRLTQSIQEPYPVYLSRLGGLIDQIYAEYVRRTGKVRWASKEMFIPGQLDTLDSIFDYNARYVYIVRHGFDVAYSCAARFPGRDGPHAGGRTTLNVENYLEEWIHANELTMDFHERNPERCHMVRYEDFIEGPETCGRRMFEFLGETWSEDTLENMENQQHLVGMGDNKIVRRGMKAAASEPYWTHWPAGLIRTLARRANPTLERLGYKPV